MAQEYIVIAMFGILLLTVFLGHPLSFTVGGLAALFGFLWWGDTGVYDILVKNAYGIMDSYILTAIPMFVFMGGIMDESGIGEMLYGSLHKVMGNLKGGLASGTVLLCTLLAASTGIVATAVMGLGQIALPAMVERKYDHRMASGAIMAGGVLGILIPPSIMLVVMGSIANISVGKLFFGAFGPGILLSVMYMIYITIVCYFKPELGPSIPEDEIPEAKERMILALRSILPPVALIIMVLGSIFFGIASPTEAASIGCLGAVVLAIIYRRMSWGVISRASRKTMLVMGYMIWVLVGASAYSAVFMGLGGDKIIAAALAKTSFGPHAILSLILIIIFLLGMILEWIAIVYIIIPVFFPIIQSLGFDVFWFCVLFAVVLQTAFLTPPVGGALFNLKVVAPDNVTMASIWRGAFMFIPIQILGIILCIVAPQIITWLPSIMIHPH